MNRKELNWHGKNMEVVCRKTANNRDLAYIYAIANATRWILTVLEKEQRSGRCSVNGRPYTDCCNCEYFRCTADEPQISKIIEAYSQGFKDGAEAVKAISQTENAKENDDGEIRRCKMAERTV